MRIPPWVIVLAVAWAFAFTLPAPADNAQSAKDALRQARALLPRTFDHMSEAAKADAFKSLPDNTRKQLESLLHEAYVDGAMAPSSYPQAGQALFMLQVIDPSTRLDCLHKLATLAQTLYARNPHQNIGVGRQLTETRRAIAQQLWSNLSQDEQTGKIKTAPEMLGRLKEIAAEYNKATSLATDLLLGVRPYAAGNSKLEDFLQQVEGLQHDMASDRKLIDEALVTVKKPGWKPPEANPAAIAQADPAPAAPPPAAEHPATGKHGKHKPAPPQPQGDNSSVANTSAQPNSPPVPDPAQPPAPAEPAQPEAPAQSETATANNSGALPPPPPDKHPSHDIFDFGREGL